MINIVPIAYDQAFLADYGSPVSDLNGIQGWNEYALFFNADEAARIPEVKLLQQWFRRSYPGQADQPLRDVRLGRRAAVPASVRARRQEREPVQRSGRVTEGEELLRQWPDLAAQPGGAPRGSLLHPLAA